MHQSKIKSELIIFPNTNVDNQADLMNIKNSSENLTNAEKHTMTKNMPMSSALT